MHKHHQTKHKKVKDQNDLKIQKLKLSIVNQHSRQKQLQQASIVLSQAIQIRHRNDPLINLLTRTSSSASWPTNQSPIDPILLFSALNTEVDVIDQIDLHSKKLFHSLLQSLHITSQKSNIDKEDDKNDDDSFWSLMQKQELQLQQQEEAQKKQQMDPEQVFKSKLSRSMFPRRMIKCREMSTEALTVFEAWKQRKQGYLSVIDSYEALLKHDKRKMANLLLLFMMKMKTIGTISPLLQQPATASLIVCAPWYAALMKRYLRSYRKRMRIIRLIRTVKHYYIRSECRVIDRILSREKYADLFGEMPVLLNHVLQRMKHSTIVTTSKKRRVSSSIVTPYVYDEDDEQSRIMEQSLFGQSLETEDRDSINGESESVHEESPLDLFIRYICNVRIESFDIGVMTEYEWKNYVYQHDSNDRDPSKILDYFKSIRQRLNQQLEFCSRVYSSFFMQALEDDITCVWKHSCSIFCSALASMAVIMTDKHRLPSDYRSIMIQIATCFIDTIRVMRKTYIQQAFLCFRAQNKKKKHDDHSLQDEIQKRRHWNSPVLNNLRQHVQAICKMMVDHTLRHYHQSITQIDRHMSEVTDAYRPIPAPKQLLRKFYLD